jgi:hypothetical protein
MEGILSVSLGGVLTTERVNYGKGVMGAVLGAAAGCLGMVFVNAVMGFTIIAGVLVSFCAGRGFMIAARQADRHTPWVCWAVSFPAFIAGLFLSYMTPAAIEGFRTAGLHAALVQAGAAFSYAFNDGLSMGQFLKDFAFNFLFLALGGLDILNILSDGGISFLNGPD